MKKSLKITLVVLLCALMAVTALFSSFALSIDKSKDCSITLRYAVGGDKVPGATFFAYRIADAEGDGSPALLAGYEKYGINFDSKSDSEWASAAQTFLGYILRDGILPTSTGATDAEGIVKLSGLEAGIYLISGEAVTTDEWIYTSEPFLVSVPQAKSGEWAYDTEVLPKGERTQVEKKTTEISVIKVWKDSGYEKQRPSGIVAQLLLDGKVQAEVALNADNNWRYTWSDLEEGHEWTVVEKTVPDNFTVTSVRDGKVFTITNVRKTTTDVPKDDKLPQTGLLWWPVFALLGAGALCIVIGACVGLRKTNEEEK